VAKRRASLPGAISSLFGLISSCQFFWMVMSLSFQFCAAGDGGSRPAWDKPRVNSETSDAY
jgi:hypothetical protein